MVGRTIQNYKIYSVLGEGGMGIVYKAFDVKLERYVALKILNSTAVKQSQFVERFRREAKNQAKLNHPNIVPVYEFAEDNEVMGIAMEYVDGESLEQMITRKGRLELIEALGILQQILVGISYAHQKGFIHRDIKPSNVIINREGVAKIMDFGISKSINEISITKTGAKVGTIMYMSPEQVRAEEPTIQSDIYSIGISFYEMLAGKTPFDYQTEFEILEAHLKKVPQKLTLIRGDLPPEVDIVLSKALHKDIHKRYFNCEEFLDDVNKLIRIITSAGQRTKSEKIQTKKRQINWKFYLLAAATFALFVVFGIIGYMIISKTDLKQKFSEKESRDTKSENYPTSTKNTKDILWEDLTAKTNTTQNLSSVYLVDDTLVYACGDTGTVIKSGNLGQSWTSVSVPAYNRCVYDIKFTRQGKGFIVGEKGLFLTCKYNGAAWTNIDSNKVFNSQQEIPRLFKIYINYKNDNIYLLCRNGYIFRSQDNGNSWEERHYDNAAFHDIVFTDEQTGFIVGSTGLFYKTTDAGNSWSRMPPFSDKDISGEYLYVKGIAFCNASTGFAVGNEWIYKTTDGGANWSKIKCEISRTLAKIEFLADPRWLIISDGQVILSEDNGQSWKSMGLSKATTFMSITKKNQYVFVAGNGGVILKWKRTN